MYSSEILILLSKNTTDGFRLKNSWSGMSSELSSDSVGMPSSKASAISFSSFFLELSNKIILASGVAFILVFPDNRKSFFLNDQSIGMRNK